MKIGGMEAMATQVARVKHEQGDHPGQEQVDKDADGVSFDGDAFVPLPQEYIQSPKRPRQYHDRQDRDEPFVEWIPVDDGDGCYSQGPDDRRGVQSKF